MQCCIRVTKNFTALQPRSRWKDIRAHFTRCQIEIPYANSFKKLVTPETSKHYQNELNAL